LKDDKQPTLFDVGLEVEKIKRDIPTDVLDPNGVLIDLTYVLTKPLPEIRRILFKEYGEYHRYRELIFDLIEEYGLAKWFEARGLKPNGVWKNRYTGEEFDFDELDFKIYTWENYLPVELWTDEEVFKDRLICYL
jgi:hypothetical protein